MDTLEVERLAIETGKALTPTFSNDDVEHISGARGNFLRNGGFASDVGEELADVLSAHILGVRDAHDVELFSKVMNLRLSRVYTLKGAFKKKWVEIDALTALALTRLTVGEQSFSTTLQDALLYSAALSEGRNIGYGYHTIDIIQASDTRKHSPFAIRVYVKLENNSYALEFGQWDIVSLDEDKTASRRIDQEALIKASRTYADAVAGIRSLHGTV